MKPIRRGAAPALALALGLGLIAGGCGSDSNDSSSDALTAAELTTQATAICTPVTKAVNGALGKVFSGKPSPEAFAAAVTETVGPELEKQTAALADLKPPSELSDQYATYLESIRGVSAQLKTDPAAPFTGDPTKFFGDSNAKATAAGLPRAGRPGPGLRRPTPTSQG
jgi:hypothetical protein